MSVSVITFPGSNCDQDTIHVFRHLLEVRCESVWHGDARLPSGTKLVVLPGGFSYGDALRSGSLARFSPIMAAIRRHSDAGGLVFGICNGFQILLEAGLLEGAMLPNAGQHFLCRPVAVRLERTDTPFTSAFSSSMKGEQILSLPIAHHEGRYHADDTTLARLKGEGRIVLTYGMPNPNGSVGAIAGITNERGNVLGMMPHPERASEPILGSSDGLGFFRSLRETLEGRA